jgi:hypothetical protein
MKCGVCDRPLTLAEPRYMHADGKTYRHLIQPIQAGQPTDTSTLVSSLPDALARLRSRADGHDTPFTVLNAARVDAELTRLRALEVTDGHATVGGLEWPTIIDRCRALVRAYDDNTDIASDTVLGSFLGRLMRVMPPVHRGDS